MPTYIALLRGINMGGRNPLPMVAKTKLTNVYSDARLATVTTGRNWRTVRKLFDLARSGK